MSEGNGYKRSAWNKCLRDSLRFVGQESLVLVPVLNILNSAVAYLAAVWFFIGGQSTLPGWFQQLEPVWLSSTECACARQHRRL